MTIDGFYQLVYDNDSIIISLDQAQSAYADVSVPTSVHTIANGIRNYVITRVRSMYLDLTNLTLLYNNANRIVSNWLAGTLLTYLQGLAPIFNTFLGRLVLGRGLAALFGSALDAMVQQLDAWYNGPTNELRRLSSRTTHHWPLLHDTADSSGGSAFPTGTGLSHSATFMAMEVTSGTHLVDIADILGGATLTPLEHGPTIEFHCRRLTQGLSTNFLRVRCALVPNNSTSGTDLILQWLSNGLVLNVGGANITCTNAHFDVSSFLHCVIMRTNTSWHMTVSQGTYTSGWQTSSSQFIVYGVTALELVAGPIASTYLIRDVTVTTGVEYDITSNIPQPLFHHGADTYAGTAGGFENWGTLAFSTPTGTVYTFDGTQDPTQLWDNNNTTVVGSKVDITIPDAWTFYLEIKPGPPHMNYEYHFLVTNAAGTGRGISFDSWYQGQYANLHNVYSKNGAEWFDDTWNDWATIKIDLDSTGLKVYFNGTLKGSLNPSQINYGFGHIQLGGFNTSALGYGQQMRNIQFYT